MAKVFFTDFHATPRQNLLQKLETLMDTAGFGTLDLQNKMVALKIHFGEPGNLAFLRPNWAAAIGRKVKEKGGKAFLTDSNTLYKGMRSNAVDHLQAAAENGFTPLTTGCQVIIADGLKGTEYREIPTSLAYCKTAKIGAAIADADVLLSITHFKGHEMSGIGGCLKNVGMGSGSVGGKLEMHSDSKPVIIDENCTGCGMCETHCAHDAVHVNERSIATIDYSHCVGCGQCIAVCAYDAAQATLNAQHMSEKMMDYAWAVLHNKPAFHISFVMDLSPHCDCWHYNDIPMAPDIGILASFDPVAIDKAAADLVNQAPVNPQSTIGKSWKEGTDKFHLTHASTRWDKGLQYAAQIGLGSLEYELISV